MPDELERRRRRLPEKEAGPDVQAIQRRSDLAALARTAEGKRIFREWLTAERKHPFAGNSQDAYNAGKRYVGEAFEKELKAVLPRELFLEILYPKET